MRTKTITCDVPGCRTSYSVATEGSGELQIVKNGRVARVFDLCAGCFARVRERGLAKVLMWKVPHPDLCPCKNFADPKLSNTRAREAARSGFTDPGVEHQEKDAPKIVPGSHHPYCQHHDAWESLKPSQATAAE